MKKITLLALVTCFALITSCNKDQASENVSPSEISPQITATLGNGTKAGVIEDNNNYKAGGELFYWSVGDSTAVLFNTDPQLNFYATAVGPQRNQATFITSGTVAPGTYDIHGFFPISRWNLNIFQVNHISQIQTDTTSAHLSNYMVMIAQSPNTNVTDANSIHLQYKQLGAVVRVSIRSSISTLQIKNVYMRLASDKQIFRKSGFLSNLNADSLSFMEADSIPSISLSVQPAQTMTKIGSFYYRDTYMALLPSLPVPSGDAVRVSVVSDLLGTKIFDFPVANYPFLANGFEQGKSYYFEVAL